MLLKDAIIGKWSAYAYDGYGSMEDTLVIFHPNGIGWFAFERAVGLCERKTFSWSLSADNLLTIKGITYWGLNHSQSGFEQKPSEILLADLHFKIEDKPIKWPGEEVKTILSFELAPFADSTSFARITTDPKDLKPPLFKGETVPKIEY